MSHEKQTPTVDEAEIVSDADVTEVRGKKVRLNPGIVDHLRRTSEAGTGAAIDVHPEGITFEPGQEGFSETTAAMITGLMHSTPAKQMGVRVDFLKNPGSDEEFPLTSFYSNADAITPDQLAAQSQQLVAACNQLLEGVESPYRLPNL